MGKSTRKVDEGDIVSKPREESLRISQPQLWQVCQSSWHAGFPNAAHSALALCAALCVVVLVRFCCQSPEPHNSIYSNSVFTR